MNSMFNNVVNMKYCEIHQNVFFIVITITRVIKHMITSLHYMILPLQASALALHYGPSYEELHLASYIDNHAINFLRHAVIIKCQLYGTPIPSEVSPFINKTNSYSLNSLSNYKFTFA